MYKERECFLCGRNGADDPLDKHHIFGGAYRRKSEQYGLTVYLCHARCHEKGRHAVHRDGEVMRWMREYGQRKVMDEQGWTVEEFIREFGKNYMNVPEDLAGAMQQLHLLQEETEDPEEPEDKVNFILTDDALPY